MDLQTLFQVRRDNSWTGVDSLYHAWMLVNHGLTPAGFNIRKFSATYPMWRTDMTESMDLRPELEVSDEESGVESSSGQSLTEVTTTGLDSFAPTVTSSPCRRGKRQLDNSQDLIIVEDLLQLLIARVCKAGIKSEYVEEDSGIVVISDDEE